MKLLIVDDSELLLERLSKLLSDIENLEIVGTAQNSVVGEELVEVFNPDAVIVDIHMPGGGFNLLEKIKKKSSKTIVCIYTNYPHIQYRDKAKELGADYFFNKSTESASLYETIKSIAA